LPIKIFKKIKTLRKRQFKAYIKITRRGITIVKALEREERRRGQAVPADLTLGLTVDGDEDEDEDPTIDLMVPPPSTAPATLSRKRARKHSTAYREAFGDSQEDPTASIKRGKARGLI
jgi:hypothetical protein